MKRLAALVTTLAVVFAGALVACTPRPASAEPVAEAFLDALTSGDMEQLAENIDLPEPATDTITKSREGLQIESVAYEDLSVVQNGPQASASYTLTWELPRDRTLSYETSMVLTQAQDQWTVRWQPSLLHPELGANQHLELRALPARPASIISSDGADLMRPGVVGRVLVDTRSMMFPVRTAAAIKRALEAADAPVPEDIEGQLSSAEGNYSVTTVPEQAISIVEESLQANPEVTVNSEAAMVSTDPGFAPDTMSRVGQIVADRLEGESGWHVAVVNDHGAALGDVTRHESAPAPAIKVSLDYNVQRAAEDAVAEMGDRQAVIVAIRPSTGQVLAVAQSKAADKDGNIGLTGQYPPGSTFKIITAAAGVERQHLTPGSIVGCPGTQDIYGRVVTNYNSFSLGSVPLERAFAASCNTTFAEISTNLKPGELEHTAKQFGLGIDYDIPGLETMTGSVPVGETPLDRTEAGYGQGLDLSSPFGLAMVSATAAAGHKPTPTLIDGEKTVVSEEVEDPAPETIAAVQQMMRAVVAGGTAAGMSAQGEIHGKTGEAEINDGSHAWFTGYRDDIAFATLVVRGGGSEIAVAATDRFLNAYDDYVAGPETDN